MPALAPTSSDTIIRTSASDRLMCTPVRIFGDAAGSTTVTSRRQPAVLNARAGQVSDALLTISDERAARSTNGTLKKTYEKLRPTGKKHVEAAVPRVGRLIAKYTSAAPAA